MAPPVAKPREPASDKSIRDLVPTDENKPFDMRDLLESLLDAVVLRGPLPLGQG